jgi:hypothetical protein
MHTVVINLKTDSKETKWRGKEREKERGRERETEKKRERGKSERWKREKWESEEGEIERERGERGSNKKREGEREIEPCAIKIKPDMIHLAKTCAGRLNISTIKISDHSNIGLNYRYFKLSI